MTAFVFRCDPADLEDLVPLFDAYRKFYRQDSDEAGARAFLRTRLEEGSGIVLAARDGAARLAGFTQLYPSFSSVRMAPMWILNDLFVRPDSRGRGVGRALMLAAADHARESGVQVLALATEKDNHAAKRLYESLGWVLDTEFDHYELTGP